MPHGFEYIVRPYQTPNAHGNIVIASTPVGTRERATLTWGTQADQPEAQPGEGATNVVCCVEQSDETSRKSTTERIEQSGKPENWVEVRRPYELKLQKKEKNKCDSNWSQMSYVAASIDALFEDLGDDIKSGREGKADRKCGQTWKFKNENAAA